MLKYDKILTALHNISFTTVKM